MKIFLSCLAVLAGLAGPAFGQQRTVYLTFDDGPLTGTANILSVLETESVPATLFMVGMHVEASPAHEALLAKAKAMPLVTVGNHSYSHAHDQYRHFYADTDAVVADLERANTVLGLTKKPFHTRLPGRDVFRLPDFSSDDFSIGKAEDNREEPDFEFAAAEGFYLYGWDHEWVHDSRGKPVQSVEHLLSEIDNLFSHGRLVKPGKLILLMHDEMFQDSYDGTSNLTALIGGLKAKGYAFGTIESYD
ncbi:polysaccharide deacetylase family protein [Oryzicola mucosus]|uniref:Chitooligosaccharide deacetylase n=1 Tax=Oryzicola mucosus TaxID=2767425 RepID=A0A8J6PTF0_9HYPH|nr:polysaccharide deacetylase family protein [Oryzicola mucosus]MBD0413102.1 polysaccharide deacetylase family protein [Oryzicola mucosus]